MKVDGRGFEDADEEVEEEEGIDGACNFFEDARSVSWDRIAVGMGAKLGLGEWDGDCWTSLMVVMACL